LNKRATARARTRAAAKPIDSKKELWRSYASLKPHEKAILQVRALIGRPVGKTAFFEIFRRVGARGQNGKAFTPARLDQEVEALAARGLMCEQHGCPLEIVHDVAVDASEGPLAENMLAAVKEHIPRSHRDRRVFYGYPNSFLDEDWELMRCLRLSVYANDETEFGRLSAIFINDRANAGALVLSTRLRAFPVDAAWIDRRNPLIRTALEDNFIRAPVDFGETSAEAEEVIERCAQRPPGETAATTNLLLLRRDISRFDFDQARRRMEALPAGEAHMASVHEASIAFLTEGHAASLQPFKNALKAFRKAAGKRKVALPDEAGVFHLLALLHANTPASREEARGLIEASGYPHTGFPLYEAYAALAGLSALLSGDEAGAQKYVAKLAKRWPPHLLSAAIAALTEMFIDADAARRHADANAARWVEAVRHSLLAARILAEVLNRTKGKSNEWRKVVSQIGGADIVAFGETVECKPGWERAFENLTAFLDPEGAGRPAAGDAPAKNKRLAWLINFEFQTIEPVEQVARSKGWSTGRAVSLKRLKERDERINYLTEHDQKVLRCLRKETEWRREYRFFFDEYRTLPALVGHPLVFDAASRETAIELVAYPVELVVRETRKGYNFDLSHRSAEPCIFLEQEAAGRWRVIDLSEKLIQLQKTLGPDGLTVPRDMRDRVAALLRKGNPTVPIRSELADVDVPAMDGDDTPTLQLQRLEEGLKVNIAVRPFGPDGPFYAPGLGGRSVLAVRDGARQRASRDLDMEREKASALIAACPSLEPWLTGEHEWRIELLEDALAFLSEAQSYGEPVRFEWPEGQALKVTRPVSSKMMSLKVARKRDWFELSGKIEVDEDLVLDMKDVLSGLDKARGRFVPLDGGRFVMLAEDFLRQLRRLEGVSEDAAGGRRLHGLASMAVDELIESAGTVQADRHWRELNARIQAAGAHAPVIPSTLQAELRDYQAEGFAWMSRLANLQMGACLADDMGLGKTVQTIAVIVEQQAKGACLVVAPTSVCHNWETELNRFAPTLTVHRLGAGGDRGALIGRMGPGDVLVTSYGLMQQEEDKLAGREWNMVVFDEAQNLKNAETKRAKASQKLEAKFRVALTGTPIENYMDELWSLFNTINPGLLGSREGFQRRFAGPVEREKMPSARDALRALIRPFILRRTKSGVLSELPARTELTIAVQQPEEERAFYEAVRRKALENIEAAKGPAGQRKLQILAEITRMRRACCHPALIDPKTELGSAKLTAFLELIDDLLRNRHKALVFSQFLGHLEKVQAALDARGVRYQYLDGSVPARRRAERVAAFQAGEGDLFLISLKAGGTGLNLTAADYVIHLDPWWNPAVEDQASDRAHRIGQTRPVTVYRLVVEDSIEEGILELHKHKRDLAADLLDGSEVSARLSEEELIGLIRA
jgi:superfamily II DNA or RNA helicase